MPILRPNVYLKEKRFVNTGEDKNVRAGTNVYTVDDGDADDIIRIENAKYNILSQAFCQRLCCAAILGGAIAAGGAGR
jgi:hypothetical protein